jgi:hypothetical protein
VKLSTIIYWTGFAAILLCIFLSLQRLIFWIALLALSLSGAVFWHEIRTDSGVSNHKIRKKLLIYMFSVVFMILAYFYFY